MHPITLSVKSWSQPIDERYPKKLSEMFAQTPRQCYNAATTRRHDMEKQPNSRMCFVCGIENPIGLKLRFYTDDEGRCIARFRPKPEHQGYPGHLHGGIISTLLDVPTQIPVHPDPLSV
jgi:hypothetical protein